MKKSSPAVAGALLTSIALLVGVAAMCTVADEPEQPAQSEQVDVQAQPEQPATSEAATAPSSGDAVEDVLRILSTGGAVPAELQDPAFDYYVDLTLLGTAWVDLDPALTADLALQFLEGERVLRRSHRVVKGADILKIAVRLAILKNDEESLARLERAIEESGNEQLAADLAASKDDLAETQAEDVWTVPVASTSAIEFARYKGVLQDIEAAIIVQDRATLKELEAELEKSSDLPQAQRARLQQRVTSALAKLPEEEQVVSEAASILDKLAHASRRFPLEATPYTGGQQTMYPSIQTQCTAVPTECSMVSTTCPEGGSETQCPAALTQCPTYISYCPEGSCQTQQPSAPTECQAVETQCPAYETTCSADQCPTQQPSTPTECQSVQTQCPAYSTTCNPDQCQTQQPDTPTHCLTVQTICPPYASYCPPDCEQPTQKPSVPTQCSSTQTKPCQKPTMTPQVPTQCSSTQTKSCSKPTLYPEVPTRCPSIMTRCPPSATYCPATCGQQQQKQRWVPPPRKKKPGGSYQQDFPDQELPSSPYRRRDDIDFGS